MSARITTRIMGDAEVIEGISTLAQMKRSLKPLMERIGQILLLSVRKNFEMGGRPTPWKPGPHGQRRDLVHKGKLRDSIRVVVHQQSVEVGTNSWLAWPHQEGVTYMVKSFGPRKKKALAWMDPETGKMIVRKRVAAHPSVVPARPFMVVQREDQRAILDAARDHLNKTVEAAAKRSQKVAAKKA